MKLTALINHYGQLIDFLAVTKDQEYEVHEDDFGKYFFDDCSDEFYINDLDVDDLSKIFHYENEEGITIPFE